MSEQDGKVMRHWDFTLTCGECQSDTPISQALTLGENTTDFTCSGCGEQWHVLVDATSLNPLRVSISTIQRSLGTLKDGIFFAKGQMN